MSQQWSDQYKTWIYSQKPESGFWEVPNLDRDNTSKPLYVELPVASLRDKPFDEPMLWDFKMPEERLMIGDYNYNGYINRGNIRIRDEDGGLTILLRTL